LGLKARLRRLEIRVESRRDSDGYDPAAFEDEETARQKFQEMLDEMIPGATDEQQVEFLRNLTGKRPGDPIYLPEGYAYPDDYNADA
jgi:hypothetical protein